MRGEDRSHADRPADAVPDTVAWERARNFEVLAEHATVGILIADENARHVYANPYMASMTGYSVSELVQMGARDLVDAQTYDATAAYFQKRFRGERAPRELDTVLRKKDGSRVPVEVSGGNTLWQGRPALIGLFRDVTKRHEAAEAMLRRLEMDRTVAVISGRLIRGTDVDEAITASMGDLGRLSGASRVYLYLLSEDGDTLTNTHEWCDAGVPPQMTSLAPFPTSSIAWSMDRLRNEYIIRIADVSTLPPEAATEKASLEGRGIQSVLALPVYLHGKLGGVMGYSYRDPVDRWDNRDLRMLRIASEIIGAALTRRRAEQALQDSEERYRTFVQTTDQGISTMDVNGVYHFMNRVSAEKQGGEPGDFVGKTMWDVFPPEVADRQFAVVREVIQSGRETHLEAWSQVREDPRYFRVSVHPLRDHRGQTAVAMIMTTDLTERRRAEEALEQARAELETRVGERTVELTAANEELRREIAERARAESALAESEQRYRLLAENVSDVIWTTDMDLRVTYVSPSVFRLRGFTAEETQAQSMEEIFTPTSVKVARRMLATQVAMETDPEADPNRSWSVELESIRKDGTTIWAELTNTFLRTSEGKACGLLGVARDVTARRCLERAILQISAREQERVGQDLHDGLCQLLRGTALMTEALREDLDSLPEPHMGQLTQIIEHLRQAVAEARSLARGLNPVGLDAEGLTDALVDLTRGMQSLYGVTCRFVSPQTVLIRDSELGRHLYRIAQEAVHNAIRHGRPKQVEVRLEPVNGGVALTVTDDGIGCPPDPPTGRGMGLEIMRYRARMIGASLRIEPAPGGGTQLVCIAPTPTDPSS